MQEADARPSKYRCSFLSLWDSLVDVRGEVLVGLQYRSVRRHCGGGRALYVSEAGCRNCMCSFCGSDTIDDGYGTWRVGGDGGLDRLVEVLLRSSTFSRLKDIRLMHECLAGWPCMPDSVKSRRLGSMGCRLVFPAAAPCECHFQPVTFRERAANSRETICEKKKRKLLSLACGLELSSPKRKFPVVLLRNAQSSAPH